MILNGWKEIANYLGRGVRTVQRWERLGLPLHRPNSRLRSAVVTTSEELDGWLARCKDGRPEVGEANRFAPDWRVDISAGMTRANALTVELERFRIANQTMREKLTEMRSQSRILRDRCHVRNQAEATLRKLAKTVGDVA